MKSISTNPEHFASNVARRAEILSGSHALEHEYEEREVLMHKVVGLGLIALLLGYIAWLATGGTTRPSEETVVIRRGDGTSSRGSDQQELQIVTLLGFDAIRSIEDPRFVDPATADETYSGDELVLGVNIEGDARAYSVPLLSRHEVVNDMVGGKPIAVTW